MTDQDIIKQSYEDTIKQLYSIFYGVYVIAQNQNERQEAEQRFQTGIKLARDIRDRAVTLLP